MSSWSPAGTAVVDWLTGVCRTARFTSEVEDYCQGSARRREGLLEMTCYEVVWGYVAHRVRLCMEELRQGWVIITNKLNREASFEGSFEDSFEESYETFLKIVFEESFEESFEIFL